MSHKSTPIPWTALVSNITYSKPKKGAEREDFHLRDGHGKEIHYFIEGFIRTLEDHAQSARATYPDHYDPPARDDVIVGDDTVRKITPTVHRWRCMDRRTNMNTSTVDNALCRHVTAAGCGCIVPYRERTTSAFLPFRPWAHTMDFNSYDSFFSLELFKTLVLYGEMDPILRLCAHPDFALDGLWRAAPLANEPADVGWDQICKLALLPYIGLNIIQGFPQTWDPASGRTEEKDYRRTRFYQYMLKNCTISGMTSEVVAFPHRRFFGIGDGQFHVRNRVRDKKLRLIFGDDLFCGKVSLEEFLTSESVSVGYQPSVSDVRHVRWILCRKGLPTEIALEVMESAEYVPERRLPVAHDPFHPDNREELGGYLKYCWKLLVRCEMVARGLDMEIPWRLLVSECIAHLACHGPRKGYTVDDSDFEPEYTFR